VAIFWPEGLFNRGVPGEAKDFRFTIALSLGLRFFSALDVAIHPDLISWFYQASVRIPMRPSSFDAGR